VSNGVTRSGVCLAAGVALAVLLPLSMASANENDARAASQSADAHKRTADATPVESDQAPPSHKSGSVAAKGPYYVDFRARTAASWGHAFVWYGKTGERAVEVAGLTPKGDTLEYMIGYLTWVPSDTGASYGDLDPQYLTAHYKVYLNEADAKRVFAYIKQLQANSPLWNAETANCTSFIGNIAEFMGLKTPNRWTRPEEYVVALKKMNGGQQVVHLSER
jgi:hypothetical protein